VGWFPLRRFKQGASRRTGCHHPDPASHEVTAPYREITWLLAPLSVQRSPHALSRKAARATGYSQNQAPETIANRLRILSWASAPPQRLQSTEPPPTTRVTPNSMMGRSQHHPAAPSVRFCPLQRVPTRSSGMIDRGCLPRSPAPSGVRNLLARSSAPSLLALFHARSALGDPLQSFVPPEQPCAVSDAVPLMAF
jgi:hypothetical protein